MCPSRPESSIILVGTRLYDGTTNAPAAILTIANLVAGDAADVSGGDGVLVGPNVGVEPLSSFGTLTLGGASAGNYTFIGGSGRVIVTGFALADFPPLDSTQSGIGFTPFAGAVYDGGPLRATPRQNGVVTGTIATIDGVADSPDAVLACTIGAPGAACLQNGVAPASDAAPARAN
jgi:hypothetical protein